MAGTTVESVLGKSLHDNVVSSKVLMVGAGGIGCELLKNLVLSGFKSIQVIDLDTIDISNLNRQFLFQKSHVKQAKAHVAKESALKFNPAVSIDSHQANIKDTQFNVQWFKQFTIVFNALDNLEARRHVNAMCLAADVPLVETGTTGYLGQAYVIQKGHTECFDCQPKETPKTYPVCTIRSTPSAPIHCIVWAKSYLFSQLFGNSEDELEEDVSEENASEVAALARETEELKAIKDALGSGNYPRVVFEKVFRSDIERLLSMSDMWKNRVPPNPLDFDALEKGREVEIANQVIDTTSSSGQLKDQEVWTIGKCFDVFKSSVQQLSQRLLDEKRSEASAVLQFDKDDDEALDFVTATTNMRAHIFGIPRKSRFEVKSMAGNIIPAIATTNAIIAGIAIMKALAILRGEKDTIKRTYLTTVTRGRPLLMLEAPSGPNPECSVCRSTSITLHVDFTSARLQHVIDAVLAALSEQGWEDMSSELAISDGSRLIYDIDFDSCLDNLLAELGMHQDTVLRVSFEGGDLDLVLQSRQDGQNSVTLDGAIPKAPEKTELLLKRAREEDTEKESSKKPRHNSDNNDVVLLADEEDGVIVLE